MTAVVAICVVLIASLAGMAVLYRHELVRIAKALQEHPEASNVRLNVEAPLPGCTDLVRQTNGLLDEMAARELSQKFEEEELLAGLAGLSHDIRTPLAGAKGYLQLAQEAVDPAEVERCLGLAEERLGAMQVMLDQLFDYTRAISPQAELHVEKADVIEILASVLVGHYPSFRALGWEPMIDLGDEPLVASADPGAMRRVFENLVSNMLKHGSGDVRIQREGRSLSFQNKVTEGAAVDEARLFERFYRGDDARSVAGAGLGLPVVKRLGDSMGVAVAARVEADSFTVVLGF